MGFQDDYVDIYSNSWGPLETGFTVGGPGYLMKQALKYETDRVCRSICKQIPFVNTFIITIYTQTFLEYIVCLVSIHFLVYVVTKLYAK